MNTKVSKYKMGWIGFRISCVGRSKRLLTKMGVIGQGHAQLNNRNGFDFMIPVRTQEQFLNMDFRPLADLGMEGIAVWVTDAQWGNSSGITDRQWQQRAIIEKDFCSSYPQGRRE